MTDITMVILAGGKSSRMGEDKGLLHVNGKAMVQHLVELSKSLILKAVIISNNNEYKTFGIPVYADQYKELGPLGGIHAGFKNTNDSRILVLSCDTPFINEAVVEKLLEASHSHDITVPRHGKKTHPLIGIYSRDIFNSLVQTLEDKELKVMSFIEQFNYSIVDVSEAFIPDIFENINTKDDLFARVQLKSFGMIAELMKDLDTMLSIPNKQNVNLRTYFNRKWPFLTDISYTIAIDQELREELNKNEIPKEIAILPPFAGG